MKKRFSIVTTSYNEYEILRQLVESIWKYIDPNLYDKLIIVDDYSRMDGKLRKYQDYLKDEHSHDVLVINFDEYRHLKFYQDDLINKKVISDAGFDFRKYSNEKPNMGHSTALWMGIQQVSEDIEFALCVDTDIIFLKNSRNLLQELGGLFDRYSKAMIIGQCIGIKSNEIIETFKPFRCNLNKSGAGGFVSAMIGTVRMDAWRKHNLKPVGCGRRISAVYNNFHKGIFERGFSTLSFPTFSKKYLLHVGNGVIRRNVKINKDAPLYKSYPYCRDFNFKYGSRHSYNKLIDFQTGSHCINMTSQEYSLYLRKKFGKTSFDRVQDVLDENLIIPVEEL